MISSGVLTDVMLKELRNYGSREVYALRQPADMVNLIPLFFSTRPKDWSKSEDNREYAPGSLPNPFIVLQLC